ncbi:MAG: DivIVA domain-containing protein [Candidatus Acidulodesulfobacterium sp.]
MELSPIEIRSQKFSKKIKGYDVTEVENFLEVVAKDLEKLYGEYYGLKEELVKKNQEITDYKEKDKSISEAILMVQSVSNDIKKAAIMEAESIKNRAISESENIIKDANKKYAEIAKNIEELLNKRIIIVNSLKNLLQTNIDIVNRESEKNLEISLPEEPIKIDASSYIKGSAELKLREDSSVNAAEAKKTDDNYDLADFLKNSVIEKKDGEEENKESIKTEAGEKSIEEMLGDINKFSF